MRIFSENSDQYLRTLAVSIGKDPASLEAWRCLHLHPKEAEQEALLAAQKLKTLHGQVECDLVLCPDGDVLMISQELTEGQLQNLADLFTLALPEDPDVMVYDLFQDWRVIRALLMVKSRAATADTTQEEHPEINFGEINQLKEAFLEAKKLRSARQPQYVMVVDDDPLTRRLVASAFKDTYALITAADAQEAVANYLLYAPDIVFLDINMPGIGGFSVLRQLIASDPDAYIVMFSGNSYLDNVTSALSKGASGFVSKPFKKDRLRRYIEDSALHHHKYA